MQTQFDKNAISPGTSYMNNFEAVLLEFVTNKIKFNTNWQTCEVIISGSSVSILNILKYYLTSINICIHVLF